MTTTLAYEWATYGIRANAIAPGPIPTEGAWQRLVPSKEFEDRYRKRLPLGRFGTPDELAQLATFLLSPMASYISGAVIEMDGAEHLQGGEFNFLAHLMPRGELKQLFSAVKTGTVKAGTVKTGTVNAGPDEAGPETSKHEAGKGGE